MKKLIFSEEQQSYIIYMYNYKSLSLGKIAKRFNCSTPTIAKTLKKNNVTIKNRRSWDKKEEEFLKNNYEKLNYQEMSKLLNKPSKSISKKAISMGIVKSKVEYISDDEKDSIIKLYRDKYLSGIEIAKELNIKFQKVYYVLKKEVIKIRPKTETCSGKKNGFFGKKHSFSSKLKMHNSKIGINNQKSSKTLKKLFEVGKRVSPMENKKHTKDAIAKIKIARGLQKHPKINSSTEVKIQNFLKKLGIEFYSHFYVKDIKLAYRCDIYIPCKNLVIECDGDYWHGNPHIYYKLNIYQKEQQERDDMRTKELIDKGYNVIRIWENQIRKMNLNEFKEMII